MGKGESNQTEVLSQLLDGLNDGCRQETEDREAGELLEIATLLKKSGRQDIPHSLITKMADDLAIELGVKKQKRRRKYIYGGLAGTAAAVCLAAFVQFWPQSAGTDIAHEQPNAGMDSQQLASAAGESGKPAAQAVDEKITQQAPADRNTDSPGTAAGGENTAAPPVSSEAQPPQQAAILQQPAADQSASPAAKARIALATLPDDKAGGAEQAMTVMLVIPNQKAQTVTIDHIAGMIRQVYHYDGKDEVVITQRRYEGTGKQAEEHSLHAEASVADGGVATDQAGEHIPSVTVQIDQYEITVAGSKTPEELKKIADSLVVKEIEQ